MFSNYALKLLLKITVFVVVIIIILEIIGRLDGNWVLGIYAIIWGGGLIIVLLLIYLLIFLINYMRYQNFNKEKRANSSLAIIAAIFVVILCWFANKAYLVYVSEMKVKEFKLSERLRFFELLWPRIKSTLELKGAELDPTSYGQPYYYDLIIGDIKLNFYFKGTRNFNDYDFKDGMLSNKEFHKIIMDYKLEQTQIEIKNYSDIDCRDIKILNSNIKFGCHFNATGTDVYFDGISGKDIVNKALDETAKRLGASLIKKENK